MKCTLQGEEMNNNDLRFIKTEENLKNSLLKLLKKKKLKEITVKEICNEARCSRNTFYTHYTYKEDLYDFIVNDCLESMKNAFDTVVKDVNDIDNNIYNKYIDNIIRNATKNSEFLQVILENDSGVFFKTLSDNIYGSLLKNASLLSDNANTEIYKLSTHYIASGLVGFIFHWLTQTNISDSEAKKILHSIHADSMKTLTKYLKSNK
ncbi:MAG: TetR/AcrR family transcriptional regulator [Clostridia bacterium]|jgi:AcrR family transcriptional regulator|nr:TetR/AcrR family transcriptional regulator [Clostridia bacterium]